MTKTIQNSKSCGHTSFKIKLLSLAKCILNKLFNTVYWLDENLLFTYLI